MDLFFGGDQRGEAIAIASCGGFDDFGGQFFRGDRLPAIDLAVFVFVDAPSCAAGAEPAELVGDAVEVRINFAIGFNALRVIAPAIEFVIAVGIDEPAQGLSAFAGDEKTFAVGASRFLNIALFDLVGWDGVEGHVILKRLLGEGLGKFFGFLGKCRLWHRGQASQRDGGGQGWFESAVLLPVRRIIRGKLVEKKSGELRHPQRLLARVKTESSMRN